MPEGPEIHRAADKIRKALEGKVIEDIEITLPQFSGREHDFLGKTVNKVEARGKALLIHFDSFVMYSHNQLYGRWTVNLRTTEAKKWNRSLRVALTTAKHTCRLWSATDILLMEPWELSGHPYLAKLGPDVVIEETTILDLVDHMNQKPTREGDSKLCYWIRDFLLELETICAVRSYLPQACTQIERLGHSQMAKRKS